MHKNKLIARCIPSYCCVHSAGNTCVSSFCIVQYGRRVGATLGVSIKEPSEAKGYKLHF